LPPGVTIETAYNRTDLVNLTIETVKKNLFEGGVLVMVVLLALAALVARQVGWRPPQSAALLGNRWVSVTKTTALTPTPAMASAPWNQSGWLSLT